MARKSAKTEAPPPLVDDATLDELEASWPKTKELAFAIDDPLEKLLEKAHNIFAGKYWENLDGLAVRIADVCPTGVTEENFLAAQPLAKACRSYFANVEKLRTGLNRPFLDAKKAVDEAAKATVARAEATLLPIINAVKKIEDRKKLEEAEAERLRLKKIEDDRLAAEKTERDRVEAEHAAAVKKLADEKATLEAQAKQMKADSDRLEQQRKDAEARSKSANDELAALRKQIENMGKVPVKATPELVKAIAEAPLERIVAIDETADWPPTLSPHFDEPLPEVDRSPATPTKFTQEQLDANSLEAETSSEFAKGGVTVDASADQQKVRDFGMAVKVFFDTIKRPLLVKQEARQAVELAVFDFYGIANNLQEWSTS